jgi:hypothetical protein
MTISVTPDGESWVIGGLLISRKLDVIALVALVLSVTSIGVQMRAFLKGEDVKLLPPDQVFIWKDNTNPDGPRARIGATLIYVNTAEKGYPAVVRRELAYVNIGGKELEQAWDEFVKFDGYTPPKGEPVLPFALDGGDAKSHQTTFIAWPKDCPPTAASQCNILENHIFWNQFVDELTRLVQAGQREYEFKFKAEIFERQSKTAACRIAINAAIVGAIVQGNGYNPTCFVQMSHQPRFHRPRQPTP